MTLKSIYRNSEPTTDMQGGTVLTLSDSIEDFIGVMIIYRIATNVDAEMSTVTTGGNGCMFAGYNGNSYSRRISLSGKTATLQAGYIKTTTSHKSLIPVEIFGISNDN